MVAAFFILMGIVTIVTETSVGRYKVKLGHTRRDLIKYKAKRALLLGTKQRFPYTICP